MYFTFKRFATLIAWRMCVLLAAVLLSLSAGAVVKYSNDFRSPRNPERSIRKRTTLIVLHTTEAPAKSSLNKLSERGEAHYCVVENGTVYRIVDRDREAFHAGRSMWNGKSDVDEFSVGIEVVGYHNKQVTLAQLSALCELLAELKALYGVDDAHVLCHSHVAYGAPNKWHKRSHRGRKQCGMLFAMPSVRAKLGLKSRPSYDPDVRAKRLIQADAYLDTVLYGSTDLFRGVYGRGSVKSVSPTAPSAASQKSTGALSALERFFRGVGGAKAVKSSSEPPKTASDAKSAGARPSGAKSAGAKPAAAAAAPDAAFRKGVRVGGEPHSCEPEDDMPDGVRTLGTHGKTLYEVAGNEAASPHVIIVRPDGSFCRGSELTRAAAAKLPKGTQVLVGYVVGGPVAAGNGPIKICGSAWREKTTYYLMNKTLVPGDKVDDRRIAAGTYVFYRR